MTGQNLNFGGINLRQNTTQQQSPPKSSSPIQQTFPMDSTNALIIQEDNCSVDGKGNESSGENMMSSSLKNNSIDIPAMTSSLPFALSSIPDQPPMDLLEHGEESNE